MHTHAYTSKYLVHHDVKAVAAVDHVMHVEDAPVPQRPLGAHLAVHALQLQWDENAWERGRSMVGEEMGAARGTLALRACVHIHGERVGLRWIRSRICITYRG